MDTDKNKNLLEKQLKAIGKKVRVDILKKLSLSQVALTYSALQKEILGSNSNSTNFSFHLNTLKKSNLIESREEGYVLTVLGRQILRNILSIEQILNVQNKSIMIRTSKYSKEPFDLGKIEEYLIKEGNMEVYQAKEMAQEVEERLSKTKIEYLTAPLMREYINAILLENGLEEIRHRLTRLGAPPFEVSKYFCDSSLNPDSYLQILGSEISEQYLLLNLLPNKLADLYISGDIHLLHLNCWSLRPLSLYLITSDVLEFVKTTIKLDGEFPTSINLMELIFGLSNTLREFKPYFSEDLLLGDFNLLLEKVNENPEVSKECNRFLFSQLKYFNSSYLDERSHILLNINPANNLFLNEILDHLDKISCYNFPDFMIPYSDFKKSSLEPLISLFNSGWHNKMRFYNEAESKLMNSTLNYVNIPSYNDSKANKIILDKILINFHTIAVESHQNDDLFLDLIQERVNNIFQFFTFKKQLIKNKLHDSKSWNRIVSFFFPNHKEDWIHNSIKAISFFGLNKAIKQHCGLEIDRIENSEKFALDVLTLIKKLINEKNLEENESYSINQPHEGEYLHKIWINNPTYCQDKESSNYSMDLIRKESKLSLNQQLELFKRFESLLDGGSVFNYYSNSNHEDLREGIKKIINSKVSAFSIKFD